MTMSLAEAREKAERLQARFRTMQQQGLAVTKRGTRLIMSAAGGGLSAVCQVYMPFLPGTQFPTDVALGAAAGLAGAFDLLGGMADELVAIGGGVIGAATARELTPMLQQRRAA